MGEVYRARDTKLDRQVALKILPDAFAADPDRLARFEREAKTLASVNHANIAGIYGLEERALIMELVEGDDLSVLIARGPMSSADALPIARQIADALEAAHERGIVHRDLKPANLKIRRDGTLKVLDFGLAKALGPNAEATAADLVDSPTITAPLAEPGTALGVILGTAAYMSPEQARGRVVDKRADIWAFGAVLYEMLTGRRAFVGASVPDVLAAVVTREIDWSRLPAGTPSRVRALIERCLEPDPKLRLRDIGEARLLIAELERGGPDSAVPIRPAPIAQSNGRRMAGWAAVATVLAAGVAYGWFMWSGAAQTDLPGHLVRLSVLPPAGTAMNQDSSNVAISPDGRMVAFVVGTGVSAENQLWVRALDSSEARRLNGGDGASLPFWSPDSTKIGFFAGGKLKSVAASGGLSQSLGDAPFGRGAAWNTANVIVFAPDANGPLYRVSVDGGTPAPVTTLDAAHNETGHRFPIFLPDQNHFLYAALPDQNGVFGVFAGSLTDAAMKRRIGAMETAPSYAAPGWLLFTR